LRIAFSLPARAFHKLQHNRSGYPPKETGRFSRIATSEISMPWVDGLSSGWRPIVVETDGRRVTFRRRMREPRKIRANIFLRNLSLLLSGKPYVTFAHR